MSEARERLIAARWFTELASEREAALITFLSRPDDLLAVLVEAHGADVVLDALVKAGVLELKPRASYLPRIFLAVCDRRTEGNTR